MSLELEKILVDIAKDNILRVLIEETPGFEELEIVKELMKEEIIPESWCKKKPVEFFSKGIMELEEAGYIKIEDKKVSLTNKGIERANKIYEDHQVIENLFMQDFDEEKAHIFAHILEHLISKEVIEYMKKIDDLKGHGISLTEFPATEGIITQLQIEDGQLLERIISMGVCPGQRILIIARLKAGIVVKLKHTQLAIDNDIAKGIMVVM